MNIILPIKLGLWIITITVATWLLKEGKLTKKKRLWFLIAGTLLFGFIYGQLITRLNPNPMGITTNLILNIKGIPIPVSIQNSILMLTLMLILVIASNRSICGWGCQLGLLQDALYHAPSKKVNTSKNVTLWTRVVFFVAFVGLLFLYGFNIIGVLDPFRVFQLDLTIISGLMFLGVAVSSIFFYRPWCRFLCPFGLVGLIAEQFSFYRPRVNEGKCVNCLQCVEACPTGAMKDFYEKKQFSNDCYACGACIEACKFDAVNWTRKKGKAE